MDLFCEIQNNRNQITAMRSYLQRMGRTWLRRIFQDGLAEGLRPELSGNSTSLGEFGATASYLKCNVIDNNPRHKIAIILNHKGP